MINNWIEKTIINADNEDMIAGLLQILSDKGIFTEEELAKTIIKVRHGVNQIKGE